MSAILKPRQPRKLEAHLRGVIYQFKQPECCVCGHRKPIGELRPLGDKQACKPCLEDVYRDA